MPSTTSQSLAQDKLTLSTASHVLKETAAARKTHTWFIEEEFRNIWMQHFSCRSLRQRAGSVIHQTCTEYSLSARHMRSTWWIRKNALPCGSCQGLREGRQVQNSWCERTRGLCVTSEWYWRTLAVNLRAVTEWWRPWALKCTQKKARVICHGPELTLKTEMYVNLLLSRSVAATLTSLLFPPAHPACIPRAFGLEFRWAWSTVPQISAGSLPYLHQPAL